MLAQVCVPKAQWVQTNWKVGFGAKKDSLQGHARRRVAHTPPQNTPRSQKGFGKAL